MACKGMRNSRRSILGKDRCVSILQPQVGDLTLAVRKGLDHFGAFTADHLEPFRPRTKANMLNDSIVSAARDIFEGRDGVKVDTGHETAFFIFDGLVAVRFKKIDKKNRTRNVATERQDNIDFHQLELAGFETLTYLSVGYLLDALWRSIREVKIVCSWGEQIQWTIPIVDDLQPRLPISTDSQEAGPPVTSAIDLKQNNQTGSA